MSHLKSREKPLQLSMLNSLLRYANEGIILLDNYFTVITINKKAAKFAASEVEIATGKNLTELPGFASLKKVFHQGKRVAEKTGKWQGELSIISKSKILFLLKVTIVKEDENNFWCLLNDISLLRRKTVELEGRKKQHAAFVNSLYEGVIVQNMKGEIIELNTATEKIFNLTGEQIIGKISIDVNWQTITEDGSPLAIEDRPQWRVLRTGKPVNKAIIGIMIDGVLFKWLSVNANPVYDTYDKTMTGATSTFIDITEQVNAFKTLSFEREQTKTYINSLTEGVVVQNIAGEIILSNKAVEEIQGISSEEMKGKIYSDPVWKCIYSDGTHYPGEKYPSSRVLKTGIAVKNEVMGFYTPAGELKWLNVSCNPIISKVTNELCGAITTITDITEKKLADVANFLNESKFSSAFKFAGIGMAIVSPQGRWMDVNPALLAMLGYKRKELLAATFQDITHPEDLEKDLNYVELMLQKSIESYQMEKRYLHRNGDIVWTLLTVSLIWNLDGSPGFFISQIIDISASKKMIEELETKNINLIYTSNNLERKMKQVDEFNRIVAHNLRGPVRNIEWFTENMETATTEQQKVYLKMLKKTGANLSETLSELLDILEIKLNDNIVYDECNLNEIINSIRDQVTLNLVGRDVSFNLNLETKTISYPRVYLKSIFYNLISNAIKYRRKDIKTIISISVKISDGRPHITVADNGLGIDLVQYGHKIFKLNQTFHRGMDSKGVGLFITKSQIETLGGTIEVFSEPLQGAKFVLVL